MTVPARSPGSDLLLIMIGVLYLKFVQPNVKMGYGLTLLSPNPD